MREKILISACLVGINCKFNGENNLLDRAILDEISKRYHLLFVCPEVYGGLSTPREPAEMKNGVVVCKFSGKDVSENFKNGAEICLKIAKLNGCKKAILKSKSPSCGSGQIYDGSFSKRLILGDGITAKLLKENEILVYSEDEIVGFDV
ncbi:purine-nucleoside phosphorylase [Campylobacter concisus]|uniref:Purine-nucleoside phosphorylase n=1 Tax=Campylobacter concisus TaxID=199 RepID=A0A1X0U435_9BACT|nr:purine-nucleoside phosphorylase [Campylobacter concisus]